MEKLSYELLKKQSYNGYLLQNAPERVLQFGEGNFMRGFVDYFIDILNEKCNFNGKVCLCQPIENGLADMINAQDGLYTLYLRGFENGSRVNSKRIISSVSRCINPYKQFDELLKCAHNPNLRFITSNTTEAGIVFDNSCKFADAPPSSFPAKLTRFLYERYTAKLKGFIILSCELIDNNGAELKRCVLEYINRWNLSEDFAQWVNKENLFCSTLVDRIVTGYPRSEADTLNKENRYIDNIIDTAECFGFWAIEGPDNIAQELEFEKAGLPVIVTPDHTPYKKRKVRILNGAHTAMVLAAHLSGKKIVRECMDDEVISGFMSSCVFNEIMPTLTLPKNELNSFAAAVNERFKNPFIDHALLAIALNSTSKWRARVMPSVKEYTAKFGKLPRLLVLSLAALIAFYRAETGKNANDDEWVLDLFAQNANAENADLVKAVLSCEKMWGENLCEINCLESMVTGFLNHIDSKGIYEVLRYEQSN